MFESIDTLCFWCWFNIGTEVAVASIAPKHFDIDPTLLDRHVTYVSYPFQPVLWQEELREPKRDAIWSCHHWQVRTSCIFLLPPKKERRLHLLTPGYFIDVHFGGKSSIRLVSERSFAKFVFTFSSWQMCRWSGRILKHLEILNILHNSHPPPG